jgi:hypothetical protein
MMRVLGKCARGQGARGRRERERPAVSGSSGFSGFGMSKHEGLQWEPAL